MNRREFIKKSVALVGTLTGSIVFPNKGITTPKRENDLAVVEGENPSAQVREAIRLLGGIEKFVNRGDRVVLLPNPQGRGPGASTNVDMVAEVVGSSLMLTNGITAMEGLSGNGKDIFSLEATSIFGGAEGM